MKELAIWLTAPTIYPEEPIKGQVEEDAILLHEIIELCEAKKLGVRPSHDVFIQYKREVEIAHFMSLKIELPIAVRMRWRNFLKFYINNMKVYLEDPDTPLDLKERYRRLLKEYERSFENIR